MSTHSNLSQTDLAAVLGIHRHTLRRRMKQAGVSWHYSTMTDMELDQILRAYKKIRPQSGLRYAMGHLRGLGFKVQFRRVLLSMRRIDGLGRALRRRQVTQRRVYKVKQPNALWHVDGHHKLIRWGIVLHGFIDGYCRTVCYWSP
jgi:hypothetical protein